MTDNEDITGLEAIYLAALDSNAGFITAVAGYPITAVADYFFDKKDSGNYEIHWFTNEKAALEASLGASVTGRRSLVMVKHVGMNVLSDPLMTAMTHTTGAGIVIIAGDDPAARASQNEQDSRYYGSVSQTAVFDPAAPQDAYDLLNRAFILSEEAKVPVIMRITERLEIKSQKISRMAAVKNPDPGKKEFDRDIWKLTMHGKHQRFHIKSEPVLIREAENSCFNQILERNGKTGIISSGYPSAIVSDILSASLVYSSYSHLNLGVVSPFPHMLVKDFAGRHERILVVEESEPFIESYISTCNPVLGKHSGHLPYGMVEKEHIEFALENIDNNKVSKYTDIIQTIADRGSRPVCSGCPFMPLYDVLHEIYPVAGDMGCSIRTAPDPLNAVDTGFSLGGAISTACGFPGKGIAVIGDFGLAHSGIVGLINAVDCGFDILVFILQNEIAAMTGGQETPDLQKVVKTLVPDMQILDIDRYVSSEGTEKTRKILEEMIQHEMKKKGVSVIYIMGKCVKF